MNFRSYGSYLTEKYGKRAYRVGVDAGFSCPNRENGRSGFGCTFCDEAGSRAAYIRNDNGSYPESAAFKPCGLPGYPPGYSAEAVRSQIDRGIAFLRRRYRAEVFLLYFQAYSGTYAPPEILKRIYDDALASAVFSELIVSTRPDCLDEKKADLLASYRRPDFDVWCETGLQTIHDKTLLAIRRGHTYADFLKSYRLLKERNIKTAVHLIFGLPGEGRTELTQTIDEINRLKPDAVKIHNLQIPIGTPMFEALKRGEIQPYTMEEHLENTVFALKRLNPEIMIMRLTCDIAKSQRENNEGYFKKAVSFNQPVFFQNSGTGIRGIGKLPETESFDSRKTGDQGEHFFQKTNGLLIRLCIDTNTADFTENDRYRNFSVGNSRPLRLRL